jgi:hypothetical protein
MQHNGIVAARVIALAVMTLGACVSQNTYDANRAKNRRTVINLRGPGAPGA